MCFTDKNSEILLFSNGKEILSKVFYYIYQNLYILNDSYTAMYHINI